MDIVKELVEDHRRFGLAIAQINGLVLDSDRRYFADGRKRELTRTVVHLVDGLLMALREHERKEHVLIPQLTARLPELKPALAEIELQHRVLMNFVADFRRLIDGDETGRNREIVGKVLELMVLLRSHMREEEQRLFEPARRARLPQTQEAL